MYDREESIYTYFEELLSGVNEYDILLSWSEIVDTHISRTGVSTQIENIWQRLVRNYENRTVKNKNKKSWC